MQTPYGKMSFPKYYWCWRCQKPIFRSIYDFFGFTFESRWHDAVWILFYVQQLSEWKEKKYLKKILRTFLTLFSSVPGPTHKRLPNRCHRYHYCHATRFLSDRFGSTGRPCTPLSTPSSITVGSSGPVGETAVTENRQWSGEESTTFTRCVFKKTDLCRRYIELLPWLLM